MAKKDIVDKIKEGKAYGMTVAEQYKVLKESHKIKPDPDAFTENFEEKLRERLFLDGVEEIKQKEKDKIENPDFERSGYTPKVEKRSGDWDYNKDDEIEFFDPLCSYELTGYKPITDKLGLDFDPTPFRETGQIYEKTGRYTAYPKGSKPYVDF